MLLEWFEVESDSNTIIKKQGYPINCNNATSYAKKSCRQCYGRGFHEYSRGKGFNPNFPELHERKIACDCVIRTLEKIRDLK